MLAWLQIGLGLVTVAAVFFGSVVSLAEREIPGAAYSLPLFVLVLPAVAASADPSNLVLAGIGIWVGWYVLRLSELARRWLIYLSSIQIFRSILWVLLAFSLRGTEQAVQVRRVILSFVLSLGLESFYIYFFTRPLVKAQFHRR